jgi:hypothetical protein
VKPYPGGDDSRLTRKDDHPPDATKWTLLYLVGAVVGAGVGVIAVAELVTWLVGGHDGLAANITGAFLGVCFGLPAGGYLGLGLVALCRRLAGAARSRSSS